MLYVVITNIEEKIDQINLKNNFETKTKNFREKEILRYLHELNRREHFRKMSFKKEVDNLINIGDDISTHEDLLKGEGLIDSKLLLSGF